MTTKIERGIAAMSDQQLKPYAAEYLRRLRAAQANPPKVERACKLCGKPFGAREMRKHIPECRRGQKAAAAAASA